MSFIRCGTQAIEAVVRPLTGQTGRLLSYYCFGEGLNTGHTRSSIYTGTESSSAFSPETLEKSNTRGMAQTNDYFAGTILSTALSLVIISHRNFNCAAYRGSFRYPINREGGLDGAGEAFILGRIKSAPALEFSVCVFFQEVPDRGGRRIQRKSRRNGVFNMYGNSSIRHHQKTGGGAYSMRAPQFVNDIAWQDNFCWKLGHEQGGDLNLFPPPEPPEAPAPRGMLLMGVGT